MIQQQHTASCQEEYLTAIGLDPARVIYFDIETTGFRASTSQLYMIGWAVKLRSEEMSSDENEPLWAVTQILAESSAEELPLLKHFYSVLRQYDTIIEFNGDRFDLPYLREKSSSFGMKDPFEGMDTVDLYQELRPLRAMLGMSRLNQKSVEQFLHITREDPFNGGELIDVYRSVRNRTAPDMEQALDALFLHNYEDVLGMLAMTPVLAYPMILRSQAPVACRVLNTPDTSDPSEGSLEASLEASFRLDVPVPKDIDHAGGLYRLRVQGDRVILTIALERRVLYHFFPNYKDYYYLPEEDTALHKSVASFVDPSHRRKATASNCYVKKEGIFLPQTEERFLPSFKESYKDKISWFEFNSSLPEDGETCSSYIHSLLTGV